MSKKIALLDFTSFVLPFSLFRKAENVLYRSFMYLLATSNTCIVPQFDDVAPSTSEMNDEVEFLSSRVLLTFSLFEFSDELKHKFDF